MDKKIGNLYVNGQPLGEVTSLKLKKKDVSDTVNIKWTKKEIQTYNRYTKGICTGKDTK